MLTFRKNSRRFIHNKAHTKRSHAVQLASKILPTILLLTFFLNFRTGLVLDQPKTQAIEQVNPVLIDKLFIESNSVRTAHGAKPLRLNNLLHKAAQTKADSMARLDYWSHRTPTGQEPWIFINNEGYSYEKAGENLAYGFSTGSEVISAWLNSPEHRNNLLNDAFIDVGFGYAHSTNYVGTGSQTVIVALYGTPQLH